MRANKLNKIGNTASLFLSIGGCVSLPPYIGRENLRANTEKHKNLLIEKANESTLNDISAIYWTSATQQPSLTYFDDNNIFYTKRLESGNFYAAWTNQKNRYDAIVSNGLGTNASSIEQMAFSFLTRGINTYALDRAGSGMNSARNDVSLWERDLINLAKRLKKPVIISQCFSTGLVAEVSNFHPELFSRAVYLAPAFNLYFEPSAREKFMIGLSVLSFSDVPHKNPVPIKAYTPSCFFRTMLFNDPLFSYSPTTSTYIKGSRLNSRAEHLIKNPKIPSTMVIADNDEVVDNEKAIKLFKDSKNGLLSIIRIDSEHFIPFNRKSWDVIVGVIKNGN